VFGLALAPCWRLAGCRARHRARTLSASLDRYVRGFSESRRPRSIHRWICIAPTGRRGLRAAFEIDRGNEPRNRAVLGSGETIRSRAIHAALSRSALFTEAERAFNLVLARALEAEGHQVYRPQRDTPETQAADRTTSMFYANLAALRKADAVVAVCDGS